MQCKICFSLFEDIDKNSTGFISWHEFQEYLQDEKAQAFLQYNCFDTSDPQALFALIDVDGDGHIDSQEFIMAMMKIKGQAKGSDMLSLMQESSAAKDQMAKMMEATQVQHQSVTRILQQVAESQHLGESNGLLDQGSFVAGEEV